MTTTREAALEAALKLARNRLQSCAIDHPTGSLEMYERSEWADEATAALSTPATEPQGYVDGLVMGDTLIRALQDAIEGECDGLAIDDAQAASIIDHMFVARPAPQPAADTRVVTVWRWRYNRDTEPYDWKYSQIEMMLDDDITAQPLFTATPAPSDKIAYTQVIGEVGDAYIKSVAFKGEHHLPAQFRWHELWDAMQAAALTEPQSDAVRALVEAACDALLQMTDRPAVPRP